MKLYLARHGDYVMDMALQRDVLSAKGIQEIHALTAQLKKLNISVATIFHSGKSRAQQTAEILAQGINCKRPIEIKPGINPNDDVELFAAEAALWAQDVLVVGHLPFMNRLVSHLLTGNENKDFLAFNVGTIVCLEQIDVARWIIHWVLTPELITNTEPVVIKDALDVHK